MSQNEINEQMLDAMIGIAARDVMKDELDGLPANQDFAFSPEFERKMAKLIKNSNSGRGKQRALRVFRIASICIVAVSALLIGAFSFSQEFRNAVLNLVMEWKDDAADFSFSDVGLDKNYSDASVRPSFIPEGFTESEVIQTGVILTVTYSDESGNELIFSVQPSSEGSRISVDNESNKYSEVIIGDLTGHLFIGTVPEDPSYVVFQKEDKIFLICGNIDTETLIRIAESIKF